MRRWGSSRIVLDGVGTLLAGLHRTQKGVAMDWDFPGALLPAWILGAPLLLAIIDLMMTPKAHAVRPG
jgi:hypothetical protein